MGFDPNDFSKYIPQKPTYRFDTSTPEIASRPILDELRNSREQLEIANRKNDELQNQIRELNKPHTLRDVLLILLSAAAGVGLTILAVVLGWLN